MSRTKGRKKGGGFMMFMGALLLAGAFVLARANLIEERTAAQASNAVLAQMQAVLPAPQPTPPAGEEVVPLATKKPLFVRQPNMEMPETTIDRYAYIGVLEIPKLSLSLPIMSSWSYPQLRTAPCRYAGSIYSKDMVIAGHNYADHFGTLWQLEVGDEVRFTDVDGNVFYYGVAMEEILAPYAVKEMLADQWDLSLFTCKTGGRMRVTIRCMLRAYTAAQ